MLVSAQKPDDGETDSKEKEQDKYSHDSHRQEDVSIHANYQKYIGIIFIRNNKKKKLKRLITDVSHLLKGKEEEEEEEEVKLINSIFNQASKNEADIKEEDILPEFEDLLSGEIDYPLPNSQFDRPDKGRGYQTEMGSNGNEVERLRNLVKDLEEREVKLEGELLEYYGIMEQESNIAELQKQLKIKTVEINMLNTTINSLQTERKKLHEEIAQGAFSKKELDAARNKIKDLQRQIQRDANQTKAQLLFLKQQVSGLQTKEEEAVKNDIEVGKKIKAVKELEVEVLELKRKNRELQHEKRELTVKLDAADAKIAEVSNMTEVSFANSFPEQMLFSEMS